MERIRYYPNNGEYIKGKNKIFLAAHPAESTQYLASLWEEVKRVDSNCVFWYDSQPELSWDADLTQSLTQAGVQMFLFPVTSKLLNTENNAVSVLLPYALENHIPIVPILMEPGLTIRYSEVFGNMQYLDKVTVDPTAISYERKFRRFLQDILISRETAKKIQAAFVAYIFLSYRKKDRALAARLMKLIHEIPQMRDVAIWYDEFLVPGEDFNDTIAAALNKSALFAMAVTPNLVEEGNYVLSTEYPEAVKAEKPILAAQVADTDSQLYRRKLAEAALQAAGRAEDVPHAIDAYDADALKTALFGSLKHIALARNNDPMRTFLIGLAYLNGIDMEVDHGKAVELITGAAEQECVDAMEELHLMYVRGIGVARDLETGIRWVERQIECLSRSITTEAEAVRVLDLYLERARLYETLEQFEAAKAAYLKTLEVSTSLKDLISVDSLLQRQLNVYLDLCRVCPRLGESSEKYAEQGLRISERFDQEIGRVTYAHMFSLQLANSLYQLGDYEGARKALMRVDEEYLLALEGLEERAELSSGREQILITRMVLHARILEKLSGKDDEEEAIRYLKMAIEREKALAERVDKKKFWVQLAECWKALGCVQEKRDPYEAEEAYRSSIGYLERAYQDTGIIDSRRMLVQNYLGLGRISRMQARYMEAEGWLQKAAELAQQQEASEPSFYVLDQGMAVYKELAMVHIHQRKWGRVKSWVEQGMQTVKRYPEVFETKNGAIMPINFLFDVANQCITWYRTEFYPQLSTVKEFQRKAVRSEGRRVLDMARGYLETGLMLVRKYEPVLGHEPCLIGMHNYYLALGTLYHWRENPDKTRLYDGKAKQIAKELGKET